MAHIRLCRDDGKENGSYQILVGYMLGLYRDNYIKIWYILGL